MELEQWVGEAAEILCSAGIGANATSHESLLFRGDMDVAWRAIALCLAQSYPVSRLQLIDLDDGEHPIKHWSIVFGEGISAPLESTQLRFASR